MLITVLVTNKNRWENTEAMANDLWAQVDEYPPTSREGLIVPFNT